MTMKMMILYYLRRQNVFKILTIITVAIAIVAYQPPKKNILDHINYWNRLRKVIYFFLCFMIIVFFCICVCIGVKNIDRIGQTFFSTTCVFIKLSLPLTMQTHLRVTFPLTTTVRPLIIPVQIIFSPPFRSW